MSHELRTPLNAVIGYSEILLEEADEQEIPDLQRIHSAGKHLLTLVSDVLDLSKLEAGKMELFVEPTKIGPFVHEMIESCRGQAAACGNQLLIDCDDEEAIIETDAAKLRQAVTNMLSNALKFTRNGTVTLTVRCASDTLAIAVRDTGIGIRRENLERLFQNFGEEEGATSSKYGGTGLGLALSQKICRLMGGDIAVESTLGKGSCFTIRVPRVVSMKVATEDEAKDALASLDARLEAVVG